MHLTLILLKNLDRQWRNSMKMWIARQRSGDLMISRSKFKWWDNLRAWNSSDYETLIYDKFEDGKDADPFLEVTFENSPIEVELKVKHSGMHLSPMFRLLDMIVIKDPSDRKRIIAYTKKLIDKLKEEGFDADARVAEEYLKMFNGESIAMATMDESETYNK